MEPLVAELTDIIQKEIDLFTQLLETLEEEQRALVTQQVDRIEELSRRKHELAEHSGKLEVVRIALVEKLAADLQEEPGSVTLKNLVDQVRDPHANRLREMRETLITVHERIRRANRQNSALIRQSMKYIDKSLQILSGGEGQTGIYQQSGKIAGGSTSGKGVVNQVV